MTHLKTLPHLEHPKYRPDIDGLRAVAILAVIIFHAFPKKIPGGFIGVDIFFVISGFLISTIVFSSLERAHFSLVEFYVRRVKRIFPALILVLVSCLVFGWFVLFVDEYKQLGKHIAAGSGFIQNFILWRESGYFDHAAETKPLLHLWSLAIEEQFYIFWPLLLAFVWKRQWSFLKITVVIATASFATNIFLIMNGQEAAAFYLPFSRFWELMVGGVLAYVVLHRPHFINGYKNVQSFFGFTLLIAGFILLNKQSDFPGWWALLPTLGTFFIISAGPTAWINDKLLANKLMIWIGLISYPLYLWHWPLLTFARIITLTLPSAEIKSLALILAVLLAWATYQFIEKPIRFGQYKKNILIWALALMGSSLIAGLVVSYGLITTRINHPQLSVVIDAVNDWEYPGLLNKGNYQGNKYYYFEGNRGSKTLFLGDSHIEQYSPRAVSILKSDKNASSVYFWTSSGCPTIPYVKNSRKNCQPRLYGALEFIKSNNFNKLVIGGCWNCYFDNFSSNSRDIPLEDDAYYVKNGKHESLRNKVGRDLALIELENLLKKLALKTDVTLLLDNANSDEQSPQSFFSGNRIQGLSVNSPRKMSAIPADQFALREQLLMIAKRSGVKVIDPMKHLCDISNKTCLRVSNDGRPLFRDSTHLRPFAARDLGYLDEVLFP
jgi:peptidoglycan/LPS O-acetylase OafA/YrhL